MSSQQGDLEERIIELETRLTFQDDTLRELDEIVTSQRDELDRVKRELKRLKEQMWEISSATGDSPEPPPPHY